MLTFVSLFAGIGGFDLGLERAGMQCAYQVEIDKHCRTVLDYHWPDVVRDIADVKHFGRATYREPVDLICGGFPCQDVSIAGRREGLDGGRSGLWFEFVRIVEELKPEWVIVENVPGLLSSNGRRDFAAVLSELGQCGYWWAYRVLDAQYFRVPQRRRRVFVVGCLARGCAQEVLFERESSPWDIAPGRKEKEEVAETTEGCVGTLSSHSRRHGHAMTTQQTAESNQLIPSVFTTTGKGYWTNGAMALSARDWRDGGPGVICNAFNGYTGGADDNDAQGGHLVVSRDNDPDEEHFVIAFAWQQGVSPDDRSYPIRAGDYAGSLSSTRHDAIFERRVGVRRLTPLECERLQGFPDDWTAVNGMKDGARYRMLGNAVCVPVAEWIGRRIADIQAV